MTRSRFLIRNPAAVTARRPHKKQRTGRGRALFLKNCALSFSSAFPSVFPAASSSTAAIQKIGRNRVVEKTFYHLTPKEGQSCPRSPAARAVQTRNHMKEAGNLSLPQLHQQLCCCIHKNSPLVCQRERIVNDSHSPVGILLIDENRDADL